MTTTNGKVPFATIRPIYRSHSNPPGDNAFGLIIWLSLISGIVHKIPNAVTYCMLFYRSSVCSHNCSSHHNYTSGVLYSKKQKKSRLKYVFSRQSHQTFLKGKVTN